MAQLNVSQAKELLDNHCILILDGEHAKRLIIKNNEIAEKDFLSSSPYYKDKAGYFKGTGNSGGGISDEQNVTKEFKKRFYKDIIEQISDSLRSSQFKKIAILCPKEDISLIQTYLDTNLENALVGFIEGNYIKVGINEVLEKVVEHIQE